MNSSPLASLKRLQTMFAFVVSCSLLMGFFVTSETAQGQNRKRRQQTRTPASIEFDKANPQIKTGETIAIRATVLDTRATQIPNAKVNWIVPPSMESLLSREYVGNVILVTRTEAPAPAGLTLIPLTALSGGTSNVILIQLGGAASAQGVKVPKGSKIEFEQDTATTSTGSTVAVSPGSTATLRARVKDKDGNDIDDAKVEWEIQPKALEEFARLVSPFKKGAVNTITIVGLAGGPNSTKPKIIPIMASAGEASPNLVLVNYGASSAEQNDNKIRIDTAEKDLVLAPGFTIPLNVTVLGDDGAPLKKQPSVTWEVPPSAEEFVTLEVPDPKKNQVELTGRFSKNGTELPPFIPVSVRSDGASNIIMVSFKSDLNQVQIYWDVIPPNICGDNFGRTIRNDYYCIDVAIVNNSPNDIRVTGISFNLAGVGTVTSSSYGLARGSLERRKLLYPRTLVLAGLSALGQLLTGFNPFFHNINHAKNYSQGIDIISNPLAKGLELAWPDSIPGEISRFEQQALRDDQIVSSNKTLRTVVFYPKTSLALTKNGASSGARTTSDPKKAELINARAALGDAIVEGYQIRRAGPLNSTPIPGGKKGKGTP